MKNAVGQVIMWIVIIALIIVGATFLVLSGSGPGDYDEFTQCLEEEGATFYGAFWCPNCQNQKTMFGRSSTELPYVECATPDGQGQTDECAELGIEAYPTWEFADESRLEGVQSLETLAEKTGCELPESHQSTTPELETGSSNIDADSASDEDEDTDSEDEVGEPEKNDDNESESLNLTGSGGIQIEASPASDNSESADDSSDVETESEEN